MIPNRAVLDAIRDAVFLADIDTGMIVDANRAAESLCGRSITELVSLHHTELHPPEDAESAGRSFERNVQGPALTEGRVLHKDGRRIPVEVSSSHFIAPDGRRLLIGVFRDISEQHAVREALRQSERTYRAIGESIDYGVWVCTPDGRNTYASESFLKLVGQTQEQCSSFGWGDALHPDDAERTIGAWKECVLTEGRWDIEHRFRGVDGQWHPVLARGVPVRDEQGRITCWAGINLDISRSRRTEESLRKREAQAHAQMAELQAVMDAVPAAIFIADDAECRHITGNRWAHDLLRQQPGGNLSKSAPEGEGPTNFRVMRDGVEIPPEELPIQRAARTGQPVRSGEVQMVFEDGTCVDLLANAEPLLDDKGLPRGAVGVLSDITERKRAESALRESEERFRNVADTAPVMIWVAGPDKLCTFFNKPWLDFTGRGLEQELGNGWADGVHAEDLERCIATYVSSFDARRTFQMEYRLRRADRKYRWVLDNGTPNYREGEFIGYIGSCIDITERKVIEERLRANEIRVKEAQRLSKIGSWELDLETEQMHWSDEILRILGPPNDPPLDFRAVLDRTHLKDRERLLAADSKARSSIEPVEVEHRIVRPNGEVRVARSVVQAVRNNQGTPVRIVGATQDITEQVKATELLRESEERLKNAERLASVGHWNWNLTSNQVTWSDGTFRIFGQPRDYKPSFEDLLQVTVPEDRERLDQVVRGSLAEKRGFVIEFRIARPDGDPRTVRSVSEVSLDLENGAPLRMFGTVQDITDERRAQEESFARQKLESIGALASGIAHDFNNLLGAVLAQAELGQAQRRSGSFPEDELKEIRNAAIRGSEIVRQLMIYAGKESETLELVDVSQIVKEMVGLLRVSVSKHVTLDTELRQDLPAIRGKAAQLRQIVMNLITNASEAIGDRYGVIRVATDRVTVRKAAPLSKSVAEGDYLQLEVSDTGAGMPPETQARIFDPFFTTKSTGHGLGLAVVQGVVRNLRGTIHLTSEPGKGTTFQILLPCAEAADGATVGPMLRPTEAQGHSSGATVLVVDDEDVLRQALVKALRLEGFQVLEADNGSAAADVLRTNGKKIDVILLDLTIPGHTSDEVVAEAARARPDMKVILMSAYGKEMVKITTGTQLIRSFIRKPFTLRDLFQTLQNVLSS